MHFSSTDSKAYLALLLGCCISFPLAAQDISVSVDEQAAGGKSSPPRFDDGTIRLDRTPGEKGGYWGNPSYPSLVEAGQTIGMNDEGILADMADAPRVAPFKPWALGLYRYRQANGLQDDPVRACISPAGPRHFHTEGGFRLIQDSNFGRVYALFGGGNRGWRVIFLDGRAPPDPEEVYGTYYGHSVGRWEGDTLVVESSGFNDRFWFSNGGLPHTEALKLTERFTRPSEDVLLYEVTVDDPLTYERVWTHANQFQWIEGEDMPTAFCEDERKEEVTINEGQR